MRRTQLVISALLTTTIGVVGCSKGGESRKTTQPTKDASTSSKPVEAPKSAQAVRDGDEGFVKPVKPDLTPTTSSFADGEAAYQAKKYADATAIFEAYTERKPGNAWGHYMLGLSAWKSGDFAKSEKAFDTALSIDPNHVKSLVNSARLFIDQKRNDDAINKLTLASEIDPESFEVQRLLARTYANQSKTDEAVAAYTRAIELNDSDVWSMNNLALLLLDAKRADEALPLLLKAVELRSNVAEFHNNLGMALEHTGSFRGAAEAYKDALLVDPRYDKAKQNLTRVQAVNSSTEVK